MINGLPHLQELGKGCSRRVYAHPYHTGRVIKVVHGAGAYITQSNEDEWRVWNAAPDNVRKHLARCYALLPCGALIQERLTPVEDVYPTPRIIEAELPGALVWDLCSSNAGFDALGNCKLIDYSLRARAERDTVDFDDLNVVWLWERT